MDKETFKKDIDYYWSVFWMDILIPIILIIGFAYLLYISLWFFLFLPVMIYLLKKVWWP